METVYALFFGVLAALAAVFELTKPKEGQQSTSQDFLRFRFNYVVVYSLMMGAPRPVRPAAQAMAAVQSHMLRQTPC